MTIVYLSGLAHSGSTYLSRILNQHSDIFAAGELNFAHDFLENKHNHCKCTKDADECPFWSDVHQSLKELNINIKQMSRLSLDNRLEWIKAITGQYSCEEKDGFAQLNRRLFELLKKKTNSSIILDSSKTPWRGIPLHDCLDNVKILHLIKSPENQLSSRIKRDYNFWHSALLKYGRKNGLIQFLFDEGTDQYLKVKFENFVDSPEREIRRITEWIGLSYEDPFSKPSGLWHHMRGSWGELTRPNPKRLEHDYKFSGLRKLCLRILNSLYQKGHHA